MKFTIILGKKHKMCFGTRRVRTLNKNYRSLKMSHFDCSYMAESGYKIMHLI